MKKSKVQNVTIEVVNLSVLGSPTRKNAVRFSFFRFFFQSRERETSVLYYFKVMLVLYKIDQIKI